MPHNIPTLLIGLGGKGGQAVNDIYGMIPKESHSRVAIHAFDTDVNSLIKLQHLKGHMTQISSNRTVGEIRAEYPEVNAWFPSNPHLDRKSITEGAGQIRAVSRLAFWVAMKEGRMNGLLESIDRIFPVQRDNTIHSIRVFIISSLAGGTGSGIFLQVAMYLRELLESRYGRNSVLIRGAFLLPDLFVHTQLLDRREWENVQANGYASMKELNAITLSAAGKSAQSEDGVTIELEYRPDQVDLEGNAVHAITEKQLPYDFCFLYDYENLKGQHLNSFSDYMDLMCRSIYLQLFSPISEKHLSQEDNQILELIASDGRGRICGAGVASIEYPYEDIVEYLALRRSIEGLSDNWLQLDKLYDKEMDQYENDLRRGIVREKPDRGERYIWNLNSMYEETQPNPFYKQVYRGAYEELDNGGAGDSKISLWLKKVEELVKGELKRDELLRTHEANCRIDEGKLRMKGQAKQEIGRVESRLAYYQEQIQKKVAEYRNSITYKIIEQDALASGWNQGKEYSLSSWFLSQPNPVHPITARYMLYQARIELHKRITAYREQNQQLRKRIEKYADAYQIGQSDRKETAQQRVDIALKQSRIASLFHNQFTQFRDEYLEKARRQLDALRRFEESLLLEQVTELVLRSVEQLCKDWERFFDNLKDTRANLTIELNRLETKFEHTEQTPRNYVLASRELLQRTWEENRRSFGNDSLPDDVAAEIYKAIYAHYCERLETRLPEEMLAEVKVEVLYRQHVLSYLREDIKRQCSDRIDIDVINAMKRETAMRLKMDVRALRAGNLAVMTTALEELSSPFIPSIPNRRELLFWGLHPDALDALNAPERQELFGEHEVADPAFSKYELFCYRAHFGLKVQDFGKFSSGEMATTSGRRPGDYYAAYKQRVDRLNREEPTVTPHLDKRWHVPASMPDLNPKQAELDNKRNDRAFILGLIYEWLTVTNSHGKYLWQYNDRKTTRWIYRNGKEIEKELYLLHKGLLHNPIICEEILERASERLEQDKREYGEIVENHLFVKNAASYTLSTKDNAKNILDLLLLYEKEDLSRPELPDRGNELRQQLLDEIEQYYIETCGKHRERLAKRNAGLFIRQLWEDSVIRQSEPRDSYPYSRWDNLINRKLEELSKD